MNMEYSKFFLNIKKILMSNKIELILFTLIFVLLFFNIGDRTFGGDENFGVEVAGNILRNGIPTIRETPDLNYNTTFTVNSPVSEYIMASSIYIFGFSEAAARIPMAFFGFLSAILIYLLVLRVSGNKKIALLGLTIITFSTLFYLHGQHARYYTMALLFNTAFLYAFHEYFIKNNSGKWLYVLIASMTLFFYTHAETAVYTCIAASIWILIKRKEINLNKILSAGIPIFLLILPLAFLILSSKTYSITAAGLPPILEPRFAEIFAYYLSTGIYYYILFFVPIIFLIFLPRSMKKYDKSMILLFFLVVVSHLVIASLIGPFGTPSIRKLFVGTFPITVFVISSIIYSLYSENRLKPIAVILMCLLLFTNLISLFPLVFFKGVILDTDTSLIPKSTKDIFISKTLEPRFYFADYLYQITNHYESSSEKILDTILKGSRGNKILYPNGVPMHVYTDGAGMKISYVLDDAKIYNFDWVILEDDVKTKANNLIDLSKYTSATYSIPAYRNDPWMDTADPVHHRFRSDSVERINVTIYKLKSGIPLVYD